MGVKEAVRKKVGGMDCKVGINVVSDSPQIMQQK